MWEQDLNQEIKKLLPVLEIILPKETLAKIADTPPDKMDSFHLGLGPFIRNNLLTPGSKLYDKFIDAGIYHKDGMSSMILLLLHEYVNNQ